MTGSGKQAARSLSTVLRCACRRRSASVRSHAARWQAQGTGCRSRPPKRSPSSKRASFGSPQTPQCSNPSASTRSFSAAVTTGISKKSNVFIDCPPQSMHSPAFCFSLYISLSYLYLRPLSRLLSRPRSRAFPDRQVAAERGREARSPNRSRRSCVCSPGCRRSTRCAAFLRRGKPRPRWPTVRHCV